MMSSLLVLKSMLLASVLRKRAQNIKKKKKMTIRKSCKIQFIDLKKCRVCNDEKGIIPIFSNFSEINISKEIKNFTGVTINKTDNLPKHLCKNCLDLLNGCIMFRDMCKRTNKHLLEFSIKKEFVIESKNNSVKNSKKLKNNICEEEEILNDIDKDNNEYEEITLTIPDNEDSCNMPSPVYSDDSSEIWGCTKCNKGFYDMDAYNSHLSECIYIVENSELPNPSGVKKKRKNFLCDVCGKTCFSNANLLAHKSTHENVFPHACDQCAYRGRTADLLKVHKRSHCADKPYKCPHCPKATTSASNLAKHVKHVHSTARPYKCSHCDKTFIYQYNLNSHVRDIHLRQGAVDCDICFKKFNTRKILRGHRLKIHKIRAIRHGRLPSYLQCQLEEKHENMNEQKQNEGFNCHDYSLPMDHSNNENEDDHKQCADN